MDLQKYSLPDKYTTHAIIGEYKNVSGDLYFASNEFEAHRIAKFIRNDGGRARVVKYPESYGEDV